MYVNTTASRKPCIRDFAQLTATLLSPAFVALAPMEELERRTQEIDITHPHFQEETPLVVRLEKARRHKLRQVSECTHLQLA